MTDTAALQIEMLKYRIEELEGLLGIDDSATRFRRLGLSHSESRVLGYLMRREIATREGLIVALYGGDTDREGHSFSVWVCRIRKRLRPHGIEITTVWGAGWSLSPDAKLKIEEIIKTGD